MKIANCQKAIIKARNAKNPSGVWGLHYFIKVWGSVHHLRCFSKVFNVEEIFRPFGLYQSRVKVNVFHYLICITDEPWVLIFSLKQPLDILKINDITFFSDGNALSHKPVIDRRNNGQVDANEYQDRLLYRKHEGTALRLSATSAQTVCFHSKLIKN